MNILSPSILSADFKKLGSEVQLIDEAGAEYIHIDVMDGMFVQSISYGMPVMKAIREVTDKVFDVHLMIEEPVRYIEDFVKSGANIITVHVEACKDVVATIEKIRACGAKPSITLNPETPVSAIEPYISLVDMVLIMSVHPGFAGQKFIPASLEKVREVKKYMEEKAIDADIEIDGGINMENLASILEAGANVIVAGASIFAGDVTANVKAFKEVMNAWN